MSKHRAAFEGGITVGKLAGTVVAAGALLFTAPAAMALADPLSDTVNNVNNIVRGLTENTNKIARGLTENTNGIARGLTEGTNGIARGLTEDTNKIVRGNVENANLMLRGFFFHP
jgi:hypothetical protein